MINYYQCLLPAITATLAPLYASLRSKPKDLKWGHLHEATFYYAKKALSIAAALSFPVPQGPLLFFLDASDVTNGTVLEHVVNSSPRPLAFLSRTLFKV
ncbi:protein NYNRIN-like [Palaemon carinicauda]|uniref:protein NYNRIN-like n=1 Tax=Palaemon carinicauda TaxID=392227 RepID=UPI0035B6AA03